VGKTRLALAVAERLRSRFADGVVLVSLAPLRDPALVASAIAHALGVREEGHRPVEECLVAQLRARQLLLVLDNFEQVLAAAPLVAELLAACPQVTVLATSRAALHLRGEHEFPVLPLALPDPQAPFEGLAEVAAVALFLDRAQALRPDFGLSPANAATVAAICRRLDGLPLAIELAAAWVKLLPPATLLRRLERRLPLLVGGARDLPERQQTLRGAIAWSYNLLHAAEQALYRRLAVFAGGCGLETVEAVCGPSAEQAGDLLGWLASLVDKNLLLHDADEDGEPRFSMLETIREYGLERLGESGEEAALRRQHAAYYLRLAEAAEPALWGAEQGRWLARLEREHDNLRSALGWARESGEGVLGLRLAGALWHFWLAQGALAEGRRWLEAVLALPVGAEQAGLAPAWAKALSGAAILAAEQGAYGQAATLAEESLALCRRLGEEGRTAQALTILGNVALRQGEVGRAAALFEECLTLQRRLGNSRAVASLLNNLGLVAREQGDHARAATLLAESLALKRRLGDRAGTAISLLNLGQVALDRGEYGQARAQLEESRELLAALGERWSLAAALTNLGHAARGQGEDRRALAYYREGLALYREMGSRLQLSECLEAVAEVQSRGAEPERGARLYGAAAALRETIEAPVALADRPSYERAVARVRGVLGEAAFVAAWAAGRLMPLEQAVAEALAQAEAPSATPRDRTV
jgi:predicted ATPase